MAPYQRKTRDEYEIEANYGQGWEVVTTEETYKAAKERQAEYYRNEQGVPFRIVFHRVKIAAEV